MANEEFLEAFTAMMEVRKRHNPKMEALREESNQLWEMERKGEITREEASARQKVLSRTMRHTGCFGCLTDFKSEQRGPVWTCPGCGGLVTPAPIRYEEACRWVRFDLPMSRRFSSDGLYFDMDILDADGLGGFYRTHGYCTKTTRRIFQFG